MKNHGFKKTWGKSQRGSVFLVVSAAFAAVVMTVGVAMIVKSINRTKNAEAMTSRMSNKDNYQAFVKIILTEVKHNVSQFSDLQINKFGNWRSVTSPTGSGIAASKVFGSNNEVVATFVCPKCDGDRTHMSSTLAANLYLYNVSTQTNVNYGLGIRPALTSDPVMTGGTTPDQLPLNPSGAQWDATDSNQMAFTNTLCPGGSSAELLAFQSKAQKLNTCDIQNVSGATSASDTISTATYQASLATAKAAYLTAWNKYLNDLGLQATYRYQNCTQVGGIAVDE
ncbi:MAG: hypothetical protein J0L93_11070 [Deltaproteobacteria bacterium]|nr:hypothetical protein [Deltaproteobacteria bacterium]